MTSAAFSDKREIYKHNMRARLQIHLSHQEMEDIRILALRSRLTLGEWVRRSLREARGRTSLRDAGTKLKAVRRSVKLSVTLSYPTADIGDMLREIESGYISQSS